MAEKLVVKAEKREGRGKNDTRRLRQSGRIPVSIYGGGAEAMALTASLSDMAAVLRTPTGVNTVFAIDIDGVGVSDVVFQDRQIDAVKGRLLHADLMRLSSSEAARLTLKSEADAAEAAEAAAAEAEANAD